MGLDFDFVKGEGPSIENPIRTAADVDRLTRFEPRKALAHVLETIRMLRRELEGRVPLIGFGGAPFTLAAYAIEGGPSTTYARTKAFMYAQPAAWHRLCDLFADSDGGLPARAGRGGRRRRCRCSIRGPAALGRSDYREFALPHTSRIFAALAARACRSIHFGVGTHGASSRTWRQAGGDVIGLDWRMPLDEAWAVVGHDRAIQGNLDPALLLGPEDGLFAAADDVLRRAGGRAGPHLQSRPRRAAEHVARTRPGAREARARVPACSSDQEMQEVMAVFWPALRSS